MNTWAVVRVTVAVLAFASAPAGLHAQGGAPCGCTEQDKLDVKSRLQQTEAAMRELDRMIKFWQGRANGSMTLGDGADQNNMNTEEFRSTVLMGELGFVFYPAQIKGSRAYGANTGPTCEVTVNPNATACLRGALQDHENVHAKACKAHKSLNPFVDWRSDQTVVDYLKEEREGYQKEQERLKREQDMQRKHCQPTQLDPSAKNQLQQALAQQERANQSNARLQTFGTALQGGGSR
ncbi:MAG: hypothetical protein A49_19980 [Methyloceanibacter sp.]|nr:MAG: hypothetical protein A49_19980 [Methyloceanibacter sp.]GKS58719.1 hypothetical protein YTPLAS18_22460 [Nitrospira sp.]